MKTCAPEYLSGSGFWNNFTGKKKYEIVCGECRHTWREKVCFCSTDMGSANCPCCGAQNRWLHSGFKKQWDEAFVILEANNGAQNEYQQSIRYASKQISELLGLPPSAVGIGGGTIILKGGSDGEYRA